MTQAHPTVGVSGWTGAFACALMLPLVLALAGCETTPRSKTTTAAASPATTADTSVHGPIPASRVDREMVMDIWRTMRFDDFAQIPRIFAFSEAQQAGWERILEQRRSRLAEYEATPGDQRRRALREELAQARRDSDEAKVAQLEGQLQPLNRSYQVYRTTLRTQVLSHLSAEQQRYWAQYVIYRSLVWNLRRIELTDAQLDRIWQMAFTDADRLTRGGWVQSDPYLISLRELTPALRERVVAQVLTREQREGL